MGILRLLRPVIMRSLSVAVVLTAGGLAAAWLLRGPLRREVPEVDARAVAQVERARAVADRVREARAHPPRNFATVDYAAGRRAAWYPQGESPLLAELVAAGKLPPLEQRIGPEPGVANAVDGIGSYGGTWTTSIARDEMLKYASVMLTGVPLLRTSPLADTQEPFLVKAYEVSDDSRVFTFHLRQGIRWSDGVPFTTADIEYCWDHEINDPAAGIFDLGLDTFQQRGKSARFENMDAATFRISFPEPNAAFLPALGDFNACRLADAPRHYRSRFHPTLGDPQLIERMMKKFNLPNRRELYRKICDRTVLWNAGHPHLGPWMLSGFQSSAPYVFVRNPYYWVVDSQGNQLPYVDRLVFNVKQQNLLPIDAANGDLTFYLQRNNFQDFPLFASQQQRGGYRLLYWFNSANSEILLFPNLTRRVEAGDPASKWKNALLNEARFRRALSFAINRPAMIKSETAGLGRARQNVPGPESPYYHEGASLAATEYNPVEASRLLDELGLTSRDAEGYRTFPDGTGMQFFILFTSEFSADTLQLVVDDWADVGVRAGLRERSRSFASTEVQANRQDFYVWMGSCEYDPMISPRFMLPVDQQSYFATAWGRWQALQGLYGNPEAGPGPPRDHPFFHVAQLWNRIKVTPSFAERKRLFDEIFDIQAEHVWTINLFTPGPVMVLVKNSFRNVPPLAVYSWNFLTPLNAGVETYYYAAPDNRNPPGVDDQIKRDLLTPATPESYDSPPSASGSPGAAGAGRSLGQVGQVIRTLFILAIVLGLGLVAFRHPFIARRLAFMVPTLLVNSILTFVIIQLPPGDYINTKLMQLEEQGTTANLADMEQLRKTFHLDRSLTERYFIWMGFKWFLTRTPVDRGLLQGDLGRSMEDLRPVNEKVGDRVLLTLLVSLGTILLTCALALPIGIYSAVRQYSLGDYLATLIGFVGMCVPHFLLAILIMYASSEYLGINASGLFSPQFASLPGWPWGKIADLLKHIWVPVLILGVGGTAAMIRVMRGNLLDELKKPYVVAARARGVRPLKLLLKYPVRIAINPFVSGLGALFPQLIAGGAIVAMVLSLPTVGPMLLRSLLAEDIYLAGSMLLVLSLLSIVGMLVSDLLLLALDPRIRMEGGDR